MKFTKTLTATAAIAMAIGMAAPATADSGSSSGSSSSSSDTDQAFLQALKSKGIHMTDKSAVSLAHSTCAGLQQGGNINGALVHVKNVSKLSDKDATTFGGFAIYAYCRQYMPKQH